MSGRRDGASPAARLRAGERLRALLVKAPAPAEVELAGHCGFDLVVLDTEHGPGDAALLLEHLRAADAVGLPALVRVPDAGAAAILQALDGGASGVVVPHITDAATAADVVRAARYPPRGERGLALTTRAGGYGTVALSDHLAAAARDTLVFVQLEDGAAAAAAGEILSVPGVDGVLIGTSDLSIALGHPGEPGAAAVSSAVQGIVDGAQAAGAWVAAVVGDAGDVAGWTSRGAVVSVFVATQLVRGAFSAAVDGAPAPEGAAAPEPVVLLPGMGATAALWESVARTLVEHGVRVRAGRIDFDDTVQEMAATVLAAAPPRFALVGHSLGGIVALAIARRAPARVTRLALLNTSARPPSEAQLDAWSEQRRRIADGGFAELCGEFAARNVVGEGAAAQAQRSTVAAMAADLGAAGFDRQLAAQATRPPAHKYLAAIPGPTLVVSSQADAVCPPALQAELAAEIRGSVAVTLPGGHMSPLEAPLALADALLDWLA